MGVIPQPELPETAMKWAKAITAAVEETQRQATQATTHAAQAHRAATGAASTANSAVDAATAVGEAAVLLPNAPLAPIVSNSAAYWTTAGTPAASLTLTWEPISTDTNGNAINVAQYEVWYAKGSAPAIRYTAITPITGTGALINADDPAGGSLPLSTTMNILGLERSSSYTFMVRAQSAAGYWGALSPATAVTTAATPTVLTAPSAPVLTSAMSTITVTWDGKLATAAAAPIQTAFAQAYMSTTSTGTYTAVGQTIAAGGSVTISGLNPGDVRYIKLKLTDKANGASPLSTAASITVQGVDLGSLDSDITDAIDAATEAAIEAHSTANLIIDSSFEDATSANWTLNATGVTNVTTHPRSGIRNIRILTRTASYEAFHYNNTIECDPGEEYLCRLYVMAEGTQVEGALQLSVVANGVTYPIASSEDVTSGYTLLEGSFAVPNGVFSFVPALVVNDLTAGHYYDVDDMRVLRKVGTQTIIDGAIITDKLAAEAVVAGKIAADAIIADNIQASAVTAEKLAADSVTANAILAGTITGDKIEAGAIETNNLSPAVGGELDISANNTVTIIAGQITGVQDDLDETSSSLEDMQTYYTFGPGGAVISSPSSTFALHLANDKIEILENGNVVSYWNSGQMYVPQFVGEKVILGNHQLEKYTGGTVVRAV